MSIEEKDYVSARRESRRIRVPNHPKTPEIEKNIPLPVEARGGLRKFDHYYPFEEMLPGDSFWVPSSTEYTAGAVTKFARKSGWKFVTRGQGKDGEKNSELGKGSRGTRVWRVT